MEIRELKILVKEYLDIDEMPEADRMLVSEARKASSSAYSPYSGFSVGAAVLLANGMVFRGNNQENAAYPAGLCAERTALFYANANHPEVAVSAVAIVAQNASGFTDEPVKPCGGCRQALLEAEMRFNSKIRVILAGKHKCYILEGMSALLPLSFSSDALH